MLTRVIASSNFWKWNNITTMHQISYNKGLSRQVEQSLKKMRSRLYLYSVGRTDWQTDGRMDTPSYRDARTHLKNYVLICSFVDLLGRIGRDIKLRVIWSSLCVRMLSNVVTKDSETYLLYWWRKKNIKKKEQTLLMCVRLRFTTSGFSSLFWRVVDKNLVILQSVCLSLIRSLGPVCNIGKQCVF